jgi:hypothetical protein
VEVANTLDYQYKKKTFSRVIKKGKKNILWGVETQMSPAPYVEPLRPAPSIIFVEAVRAVDAKL